MKQVKGSSKRGTGMNRKQVDHLAHALGTTASRRQVLKFLAAGAAGGALLSRGGLGAAPAARAVAPANDPFSRTWARTDQPIVAGEAARTWMWGPEAFTEARWEPYLESPNTLRQVQYFDKSRMEITHPDVVDDGLWYVTNGLLVKELITGQMQVGDTAFEQREPARVNVAGDPGSQPVYADFLQLLDVPALPEGATIDWRLEAGGAIVIGEDGLAGRGVTADHFVPETNHTVAKPFWEFMNASGIVYQDGQYVDDLLFINPFYATGFPITEAYWTQVTVLGTPKDVLVQCFERRCLTYTPDNPPGWRVEAGNVGQHYYTWRYGEAAPLRFCVPAVMGHKPKVAPEVKLRRLAENTRVPSVLAGAIFQMARRFIQGDSPANAMEASAFETFRNLSPDLQHVLACSLQNFDAMPIDLRTRLVDARFGLDDAPVTVEGLSTAIIEELTRRASDAMLGDPDCLMAERPGLARPTPGIEPGEVWFTPSICRVNGLRTIEFGLSLAEYRPDELQHQCSLVPIDSDGDGAPDGSQLSCEVQRSPCPGNELDGVCLRVSEVRPGDAIALTGVNFFNTAARIRLESTTLAGVAREVEAHVCGDATTPLTEVVGGVERTIADCRVQDQLVFVVPDDLPTGIYTIRVIVPNNTGDSTHIAEFFSLVNEYIQIVAPPTTQFQIAAEELFCREETDIDGWFSNSDEVALRILTIPLGFDGVGRLEEHRFGSGALGIFEDVDSGESRDLMDRVVFARSNIAGVAMAIIGYEVDDEGAFQEQIQGFADAYAYLVQSTWNAVIEDIGDAIGGILGPILGVASAVIAEIVVLVFGVVFALWAPADLIIEDMVGLSSLDLDMLTSPAYPAPPVAAYTTGGDIGVTVESIMKDVEYREERWYDSGSEGSRYRITLRYNRL